jgi:two-component system LytT family response regulator
MTLRAMIIEDEPLAAKRLRRLLVEHADVSVVAEARNAAEATRFAAQDSVDVVFVDIEMPGGSGMELVRTLSPRPAVVFTTAHAHYAADAFDQNAVDYLIKPVESDRLGRALNRVRRSLAGRGGEHTLAAPLLGRRIAVRKRSEVVFILVADITWVAAEGNYCHVHANGEVYVVRQTIGDFAERVGEGSFVRVHRSALVNAARIRRITGNYDDGYTVVLEDDTTVRVGSSYSHLVRTLVSGAL